MSKLDWLCEKHAVGPVSLYLYRFLDRSDSFVIVLQYTNVNYNWVILLQDKNSQIYISMEIQSLATRSL